GSMPDKFEIAGVFQSLLSELRLASLQQTDLAFKVGYLEAFKRNEQPEIKVVPDSYNASEIWAGQESRIVKLDEIAKRDFMNPSSDCRFFLVPNQEERQEGVSDE
ncbi:MAG: hypothetical protein ACE5DM_03820, partial [Candidatus Nanoarchaeia archaeon]